MQKSYLDEILYFKAKELWDEIQKADSEEEILDILGNLIFHANDYANVLDNEGPNGESFETELAQHRNKREN